MTVFKIVFPNKEISPFINLDEDQTLSDLKSKILDSITNDDLKSIIKDDFNLKFNVPSNDTYLAEGMDPCQPDIETRGMTITPIMLRKKIKDLSLYLRTKCNDDSHMLFLTSRNYNDSRQRPEELGSFYDNYGSKKKSKKNKTKKSKKPKKSNKPKKPKKRNSNKRKVHKTKKPRKSLRK